MVDVDGSIPSPWVVNDGPDLYDSTLPISSIVVNLQKAGIACLESSDAGDYVCNYTFYLLMHLSVRCGVQAAGLIHVPNEVKYRLVQGKTLDLERVVSVVVASTATWLE